jgi:serpin B
MRLPFGLIPLVSFLSAIACAVPLRAQESVDVALARQVAEANNAFGVALYREFAAAKSGNLVFSPFSLSSALALTATGARGQTEKELWQALQLDLPRERVAAGYAAIGAEFARATRNPDLIKLTVANALWVQQGYALQPEFLGVARQQFAAEVTPLDYAQPDAAAERINAWIAAKTAGLIPRLVEPAQFGLLTRLTLCNAVHFKAAWGSEFVEGATKPERFTLLDRSRIEVPTMKRTEWFQIAEADGCRLLRLPYARFAFEMVIVLPDALDGLGVIECRFDRQRVQHWMELVERAKPQSVALELPRFKAVAQPDCMAALSRFGVKAAFDLHAADLSGISSEPMFSIGGIRQVAVVEVNERGTEAAAVTVSNFSGGYAPPRAPKPFKVDHPFFFFIREERTGAILFMGRIVDPQAE